MKAAGAPKKGFPSEILFLLHSANDGSRATRRSFRLSQSLHMWSYLVLYVLPLVARFVLADHYDGVRIALSLLPLAVVFPSTLLPVWIKDEENEHVWRHSLYAIAFTVSAGSSIRWDVVAEGLDEPWASHLILYLIVGALSLWWFVVSHVIENHFDAVYTHQGDIAVLPLTLVAIGTFASSVPDEAFQFSRSIIFYVPIVVAWATLHFVAFNGFAQSSTTTHSTPGFAFLAHAGLVIAVAQLALIEMRATPTPFLFLPLVASVLCQVTTRPTAPAVLRPRRLVGMWVIQVGLSVGFGAIFSAKFDATRVTVALAVVGAALVLSLPPLCGNRWVLPTTLYTALVTATYAATDEYTESEFGVFDAAALTTGAFLIFQTTHCLASPEDLQPHPPCALPPSDTRATPQSSTAFWTLSGVLRLLDRVPVCHKRVHGDATLRTMLARQDATCPQAFAGVWWMCGNAYPMQLTTVHSHRWSRTADGARTATFSLRGGTRSASVAGLLNLWGQSVCFTTVHWRDADRWIRTPGWLLPVLRLLPDTYWLYRVDEDEMLRLVYDRHGTIVWQYRMLRVVRGDGRRTQHHRTFMDTYEGRPCLLG